MASSTPDPKTKSDPPSPGGHNHGASGHHHHGHSHGHHGAVKNIKIAFFLNFGFTILEIFGGLYTNSVAILTDALHDLGDSLSLGLSWFLEKYSAKERDKSYSYGYARFSVLGAFINSSILVVGSVLIMFETIPRLMSPEETNAPGMVFFAVVGILANGAAVLRLKKGTTLNERVVAIHLLEDVLGWTAILIGSIVMLFVDVPILDPIMSLAILGFVLFNVFRSLRASLRIFLQGTPQTVNLPQVRTDLLQIEGVLDVHDLHLWTLDGEFNVASLHLTIPAGADLTFAQSIKKEARHILRHAHIEHATIEVEPEGADCELADC